MHCAKESPHLVNEHIYHVTYLFIFLILGVGILKFSQQIFSYTI